MFQVYRSKGEEVRGSCKVFNRALRAFNVRHNRGYNEENVIEKATKKESKKIMVFRGLLNENYSGKVNQS